jgi:hypothetical protein
MLAVLDEMGRANSNVVQIVLKDAGTAVNTRTQA